MFRRASLMIRRGRDSFAGPITHNFDGEVRAAVGPLRLRREQLNHWLPTGLQETPFVRNWLGTSLLALDGSHIGAIHLLNRSGGDFSALGEAVLVHLAQMAAAAVQRARLHGGLT